MRDVSPLPTVVDCRSTNVPRVVLFVCFLLSGFTGLLYQTVWVRLALASFGVNSSIVATVLSVFMAGLALGTFTAGRYVERIETHLGFRGLQLYGLSELAIGIGGCLVPPLLGHARELLLTFGATNSVLYTTASAVLLTAILLPFCTAMGLTFPAAVSYLRRYATSDSRGDAFSFLYLPNVAGALLGVLLTSFVLIELFGFLTTALMASAINVVIAAAAFFIAPGTIASTPTLSRTATEPKSKTAISAMRLLALFLTGFSTMGMEVIWIRIYPFFIGTFVYSFAAILATYLVATAAGSAVYRWARTRAGFGGMVDWWPWLCIASLLPLLSASIKFELSSLLRIGIGLVPFCFIMGYLTPLIMDEEAGDHPRLVGRAYALNLLGCVLGPLLSGFVLLPAFGTKVAAIILAAPLFLFLFVIWFRRNGGLAWSLNALTTAALLLVSTTLFEDQFPRRDVRHDPVATVVAAGEGMVKHLFVNGVGMTGLTPITKMMAHFPAAHVVGRTKTGLNALVICFGMGTSFRSLASWGVNVTAVELVPSVPRFFGYYFTDGPELRRANRDRLRIEIDDGRRFLDRSRETFDVITIDPPPPVEAAASSLLYSKDFYRSALARLSPNGILQAWLPGGDAATVAGVTQALLDSFPYVRAFRSIEGWGIHYLASKNPIPRLTAEQLLARMPQPAIRDMTEWKKVSPLSYLNLMLSEELDPRQLLASAAQEGVTPITDDYPVNEFFFLRRYVRGQS